MRDPDVATCGSLLRLLSESIEKLVFLVPTFSRKLRFDLGLAIRNSEYCCATRSHHHSYQRILPLQCDEYLLA